MDTNEEKIEEIRRKFKEYSKALPPVLPLAALTAFSPTLKNSLNTEALASSLAEAADALKTYRERLEKDLNKEEGKEKEKTMNADFIFDEEVTATIFKTEILSINVNRDLTYGEYVSTYIKVSGTNSFTFTPFKDMTNFGWKKGTLLMHIEIVKNNYGYVVKMPEPVDLTIEDAIEKPVTTKKIQNDDDVWELALKIMRLSDGDKKSYFGDKLSSSLFTIEEARDIMSTYERDHDYQIGDEVITETGEVGYIIDFYHSECDHDNIEVSIYSIDKKTCKDGGDRIYYYDLEDIAKKTGKHNSHLAMAMKEIKEEINGNK